MITTFYSKDSNNKVIEVELFSKSCVYRKRSDIINYPELDNRYEGIQQFSISEGQLMISILKKHSGLRYIDEESRYS